LNKEGIKMALKIMYRLLVAQNAKRPTDANIKSYDMEADTYENRNAALLALGWSNNSGKDPDVTEKKFMQDMLKDNSVDRLTVLPVLIDDVSGKSYELQELDPQDYAPRLISRKTKEIKGKERELWVKSMKDVELDFKENYEIIEENEKKKSKSSTSISESATSTSVSSQE
jgi:hypothetical protein